MDRDFERTIFIDIEMAGLSLAAPIIEVAAVAVHSRSYEVVDTIDMKIAFDMSAVSDYRALGINKFSADRWSQYAIPEEVAAKKLAAFFRRYSTVEKKSRKNGKRFTVAQLAGHNADLFDTPRLQYLFDKYKLFFPCTLRTLCTEQKARWLFHDLNLEPPVDFKLGTLCKHLDLEARPAHTALSDTLAAVEVARALAELYRAAASADHRRVA